MVSAGSGTLFRTRKSVFFEEKIQKVVMGFYREERVPKSHCFELTCGQRGSIWMTLFIRFECWVLRAPAVHGVSSINNYLQSFTISNATPVRILLLQEDYF